MMKALDVWHNFVKTRNTDGLSDFIADDAELYSPVVFKPIQGQFMVPMYLMAALQIIANDNFKYIREISDDTNAFLEFETEIEGITVNGVDMITFNEDGKLQEIKVMIRPLKAVNIVHKKMGEYLEKMQS